MGRPVKITREILEEYSKAGLTDKNIAELLEVSQPGIHYARKRLNIEHKEGYRQNKYNIDKIKELTAEGKSAPEISEELCIPYTTTMWLLKKHNIKTAKKWRRE